MKKLSLLSAALIMCVVLSVQTCANAAGTAQTPSQAKFVKHHAKDKEQMRKQFEDRLKLTDKQKEKAKKLHEKGRAQMEPVMKQMKSKYEQMQSIQQSEMTQDEKEKALEQVRVEIKALNKQVKEVRKKNSEDFEKILNKDQKAELDKMKSEGRAKFEREHKARPPFQGLGSPNFFFKSQPASGVNK